MSRPVIQNFRGLRGVVLHGADRNRSVLTETLTRLGLKVDAADPLDGAAIVRDALKDVQLILFDADFVETVALSWASEPALVPLIAIIGLEAPGRLLRAFELEPNAVIHKPVRSTGIYSALFFAVNEHRRRQDLMQKVRELEGRHRSRRFVTRAVVQMMQSRGIDDDQAYRLLRKESMRRRLTIEEFAVQFLATGQVRTVTKAREA
ncbi:MAG TPA: ANTAR domain-containing protein [Xanthobacteraceae bacterium]|nr:ANTAR domain-containing protein [Xanthobacteraceae bacterium]